MQDQHHTHRKQEENIWKNFLSQNFCFASVTKVSVTLRHVDSSHSVPQYYIQAHTALLQLLCVAAGSTCSLTFTVNARTPIEILKIEIHLKKTYNMDVNGALCDAVYRRFCDVTRFHCTWVVWKLGCLFVLDRDVDWRGKKLCNCAEAPSSLRRFSWNSGWSAALRADVAYRLSATLDNKCGK